MFKKDSQKPIIKVVTYYDKLLMSIHHNCVNVNNRKENTNHVKNTKQFL